METKNDDDPSGLPTKGAVPKNIARPLQDIWCEEAARFGVDLSQYEPRAPLGQRIAWAKQLGLQVGSAYSRFSTKLQKSTEDQLRACMVHAARSGIYIPVELLCIDEGVKGRRVRRDGLDRLRTILDKRLADVMLVFKASRLFRQAYKGYQFVLEEVVERGLRAISVSQNIDTADNRTWKLQLGLHGLIDDAFLEATADHVRLGLEGLFAQGYVTGALTVGYRRKELPDATPTNRGLPRTVPDVDPDATPIILRAFEDVHDGMPLAEAWRRYRATGGPYDPRSTLGYMSKQAFRRMLSNPRLIGVWSFGTKRNEWSAKRDYARQVARPEQDVIVRRCEELRIVPDELFFAVQERLATQKSGRRPQQDKESKLYKEVTGVFHCATCRRRMHRCGSKGLHMSCPNPDCQQQG